MDSQSLDEFDEELWNIERQGLEADVIYTVMLLSHFMGCNSFTLPTGLMKIKVNIVSEQLDALSD